MNHGKSIDKPTGSSVLISTPSHSGHYEFMMEISMEYMVTQSAGAGHQCFRDRCKSSNLADLRCMAAQKAIDMRLDYLLFVDADMVVEPQSLNKLLAHDLDVVGGLYVKKGPPYWPVASKLGTHGLYESLLQLPYGELIEVDGIGAGFLLINTRVLRAIDKDPDVGWPWFCFYPAKRVDPETRKVRRRIGGEDYYFCEKAKKCGFKIWCDTGVSLGHAATSGEAVFRYEDHAAFMAANASEILQTRAQAEKKKIKVVR